MASVCETTFMQHLRDCRKERPVQDQYLCQDKNNALNELRMHAEQHTCNLKFCVVRGEGRPLMHMLSSCHTTESQPKITDADH